MAKKQTFISYDVLPESRDWKIGHIYRTKLVLRQIGLDEDGATFEVVDATSLEPNARQRYLSSEEGSYGSKS